MDRLFLCPLIPVYVGVTTPPATLDTPEDAATPSQPSFNIASALSQAGQAEWLALSSSNPSTTTAGTGGVNLFPNVEDGMSFLPGIGDFTQGMDTAFLGDSHAGPLTQPAEYMDGLSTSASDLADKVRSLEAKNERLESMVNTQGRDMAATRSEMGHLNDHIILLQSILSNNIRSNGSQIALLSSVVDRMVNPNHPTRPRLHQRTLTSAARDL